MRFFYITNARLPTEKAHGLATVKLCEAFAGQGAEVTIFAPWRWNPLRRDLYDYYGVRRNFRVCRLPSIDFLWLSFGKQFFFSLQLFSFSVVAALWLFFRYGLWGSLNDVVIFSHDHTPLFFASFFSPRMFYDIHDYPRRTWLYARVLRRAVGIAVQTKWKIAALGRDFGIPASNVVYWPNGTDIERFDILLTVAEARAKLRLPQEKHIVLYTGSLQRWKGVDTLVATAQYLAGDVVLYIVGGSQAEISKFHPAESGTNRKSQVRFVCHRPWTEIPLWLKAADVLVLPNTGREEVSRHYTSPMKLFEYMAAGRPIVASDIPSIREIADESAVFFAEADNPKSFAGAVQRILGDADQAGRRAERARREVKRYTWAARAERILTRLHRSA